MIDFLNINSDSIIAIFTIVLVIITAHYTYLTNKLVKSNSRMFKENFRPHVVAFFENIDHNLYFIIKNAGNRDAIDIKLTSNPQLKH